MKTCPKDGCGYESPNRMGLGVHWSKIGHEGLPPWKTQTCDWCDTEFARCDSQMTEDGSFCSEECYASALEGRTKEDHSSWKENVEVICDECGTPFSVRPSRADRYPHTFCNYDCFASWETDHGESRNYGPNWQEIRQKVIDRDGNICTYDGCNRTECTDGRSLHVHHILPFVQFDNRQKANQMDNLRTLCDEHHRAVEVANK